MPRHGSLPSYVRSLRRFCSLTKGFGVTPLFRWKRLRFLHCSRYWSRSIETCRARSKFRTTIWFTFDTAWFEGSLSITMALQFLEVLPSWHQKILPKIQSSPTFHLESAVIQCHASFKKPGLIRYDRCISGMNTEFNVPDASPMSQPPTFHPNHFPPKCSMPRVVAIGGWAESRCSSAAGNFTCPKENLGPRGHAMSTAQCLGSHIPIRKPGPA